MSNIEDFPRPITETEERLQGARRRLANRIADECMEDVLPKMAERPMSAHTAEYIRFRLEQDGHRIDRLRRVDPA